MKRRKAIGIAPAKKRLIDALAKFTCASPPSAVHPTAAALCRLAGVSRNTLYRDHPEIAERIRRLRLRSGRRYMARTRRLTTLRTELGSLRAQLAKLAALTDHYHAAAEELRSQLAHRERELAALRERARPIAVHRASTKEGLTGAPAERS